MRQTSKRAIKKQLADSDGDSKVAATSRPALRARRQTVRPISPRGPAKFLRANQPETPNHKKQLTAVKRADFALFKGRHHAQLLLRTAQRITY